MNSNLPNEYKKAILNYENSIFFNRTFANLFDYALFLLRNDDFNNAQPLFEEVIKIVDDNFHDDETAQKYKAASLSNISNILRRTGFYEDSLIIRTQALDLQIKIYREGDKEILLSKYNLAMIYSSLKNTEKALYYIAECIDQFDSCLNSEKLDLEFNKGHILNGSGVIYADANILHEATEWFIKAFDYRKTLTTEDNALDFCLISESAYNVANASYNLHNFDKAKQFALIAQREIRKAISFDSYGRFLNDNKRVEGLLTKLERI